LRGARAGGPGGIVAEEMAVELHSGSAAGGVDDDGVYVGLLEEGDEAASHSGGLIVETGVEHEGAAAGLVRGRDDLAAFSGKDSGGGGVDVGEEDGLDASGEHADAAAWKLWLCRRNTGVLRSPQNDTF
jgi:hypothetical protein